MRWAFLFAGFLAGLGLGLTFRRDEASRAPRATHNAHTDAAAPSSERDEPPESDAASDVVAVPTAAIGEDDGPEAGWGRLQIDFSGMEFPHVVHVVVRELWGEPYATDGDVRDDTSMSEYELRPGIYPVWWRNAEGWRVGLRARVEELRVTRVHASVAKPLPLPAGLGAIDVLVTALNDGSAEGIRVIVKGHASSGEEEFDLLASAKGRVRFELVPGTFRVRVGMRVHEVTVTAGKTARVEFRHENEGDLSIRGHTSVSFRVLDQSGQDVEPNWRFGRAYMYLTAGEYAVVALIDENGHERRSLGRVLVEPRRSTTFDHRLPEGELSVRLRHTGKVDLARPTIRLRALGVGMMPRELRCRPVIKGEDGFRHEFICLSAGRYVVEVIEGGWRATSAEVDVGAGETKMNIPIEPAK